MFDWYHHKDSVFLKSFVKINSMWFLHILLTWKVVHRNPMKFHRGNFHLTDLPNQHCEVWIMDDNGFDLTKNFSSVNTQTRVHIGHVPGR